VRRWICGVVQVVITRRDIYLEGFSFVGFMALDRGYSSHLLLNSIVVIAIASLGKQVCICMSLTNKYLSLQTGANKKELKSEN